DQPPRRAGGRAGSGCDGALSAEGRPPHPGRRRVRRGWEGLL
ncbi:MAG: hypothetical protein AVDCRST_MAG19-3460, partial [uncultured Thermomicrobiales bacterium]